MLRYLSTLLIIISLCVSAAFAGTVEDADAAMARKDYEVALRKFKLAAIFGEEYAQFQVGNIYREGLGLKQDFSEAVHWYKLAAIQGNAAAQTNLGVMYGFGWGVTQDYAEEVRWYKLAAAQGYVSAQYNLGHMYRSGKGVPQDFIRAYMWLNLAAMDGNVVHVTNRDEMLEKMSPQQIAEAQKLSRECQARNFKNCD